MAILGAAVVALSRLGLIPDRPKQSIHGLRDRKPIPDGEIFQGYWADCGLPERILLPLLKELGSKLDVEPSLLRPGDGFYRELLPIMSDGLFDDGFCELYWMVEEREKKYGVPITWSEDENLGEFIKAIGAADAAYTASLSCPLPKSSLA